MSDPDYIVPLVIDKDTLNKNLYTYMASGDYAPFDLIDNAKILQCGFMYVPAYRFKGTYEASWTASFGYDRQEHYTDYESRYDSDLKRTIKTPVTKTKTVTDWSPASGTDTGVFDISAYAGSSQPSEVAQIVHDMSWEAPSIYEASLLSGLSAEGIAKTGDQVYEESAQPSVNAIIDSSVRTHGQGDRQQDWNWTATTSRDTTSYYLPIGFVTYKYGDKEYRYWLDGASGSVFMADELPVDTKRKNARLIGYIPGVITILIGAALANNGGNDAAMSMGLLALAFGGIRHYSILNFAKKRRQTELAEKLSEDGGEATLTEDQKKSLSDANAKPGFFANTSNDKIKIPLLTVVFVILAVLIGAS